LRSFDPPYPSRSRFAGEEGTVLVKVSISPLGAVLDAQVERSSGYQRLDEAALQSIRSWRFAPATRGAQAVASWVSVPVKFILK
jgi:protein TonB